MCLTESKCMPNARTSLYLWTGLQKGLFIVINLLDLIKIFISKIRVSEWQLPIRSETARLFCAQCLGKGDAQSSQGAVPCGPGAKALTSRHVPSSKHKAFLKTELMSMRSLLAHVLWGFRSIARELGRKPNKKKPFLTYSLLWLLDAHRKWKTPFVDVVPGTNQALKH